MVVVPENMRKLLKKPLGKLCLTYEKIKDMSKNFRIISVGDVCTLALLAIGIRPHLAVFDYKIMRKHAKKSHINILKFSFKNINKLKNKPGTVSDYLLKNAKKLIRDGGAIFVDGEEDLTALAFIKNADKKTIVIYGQPHEGVVIVTHDKRTKKLVNNILNKISHKKRIRYKKKKIR